MMIPLQVLLVEDSEDDALLLLRELRRGGYQVEYKRVETAEALQAALSEKRWDIIIADYTLPHFSGLAALKLIQEQEIDIPFLMVSGTVDEEMAVAAMKAGAHDYLMKNNLKRLVPAVQRELREAIVRLEHQLAEKRIREQAALLNATQDAILVCDFNDRIQLWNQSATRLYGWSEQEACGSLASHLLFKGTPSIYPKAQAILQKKGEWQGEFQQLTKARKTIIVESRWKLLKNFLGEAQCILIVNTDITDKKQLQDQFLRTQRLESIGTLAGGIAHDLNNVLAPILMGIEILRMRSEDLQTQKLLDTLESSAKRGADIVKQVLTFARGTEGDHSELQLKHLVREILEMVKETFPKSISIASDLSRNLWLISGDATQLQQVLLNLCVNARDAMPNGGSLKIKAENIWLKQDKHSGSLEDEAKPYILLSVSDTGAGIPAPILDKIFEPFFTTKPVGQGTGLGLSTTSGIVKSHGGFIRVESQEGKGSCLKIYLPAQGTLETASTEKEGESLPLGAGELILVVDDEASIRDISKQTLEACGYRVLTAEDASEAVAVYTQHRQEIRVAIVDEKMPVTDGLATIQILQKINADLKVIAVSGFTSENQISLLKNCGIHAFLSKPYTATRLLKTVSEVLKE